MKFNIFAIVLGFAISTAGFLLVPQTEPASLARAATIVVLFLGAGPVGYGAIRIIDARLARVGRLRQIGTVTGRYSVKRRQ